MRYSSKTFLITADDTLYLLPNAVSTRILRHEPPCRMPAFAGQRVRQASIDTASADGQPPRVVRSTFGIFDIDSTGMLDIVRFTAQQFARFENYLESQSGQQDDTGIVNASSKFMARGGSWKPQPALMRRLEAAALGQLQCPRVRISE